MTRSIRARRRQRRMKFAAFALLAFAVMTTGTVALMAIDVRKPSPQASVAPVPTYPEYTTQPQPTQAATTIADPNAPLLRIAIAGDIGTRDKYIQRTGDVIAAEDQKGRPFDALVIPGDLVYDKGEAKLTNESVIAPFAKTFTTQQIIPAIGNHDIMSDEEMDIMRQLGRPSVTYSAQVGPVRFLVLDSNDVNSQQTQWMETQLKSTVPAGTWTIPVMHHPAYSSGMHGSTKSIQQKWSPLWSKYKVALVIAGHDHDYERSKPQNGVTYLVSGGAAELRSVGKDSFSAFSSKTRHFVDLTVYSDRLVGRAIDQDDKVFDQWTIPRPQ